MSVNLIFSKEISDVVPKNKCVLPGNATITVQPRAPQGRDTEHRYPHNSKNTIKVKQPGLKVIKLFQCSAQLSTIFILLINVKMPTIVGILTFISMINTTSERLEVSNLFICRYFRFCEQFGAHLS